MKKKTKQCIKCKQVKPLNEFHKNIATKDGKTNKCMVCNNIANAINRKKKKEAEWGLLF